jgi:hypothetical protein
VLVGEGLAGDRGRRAVDESLAGAQPQDNGDGQNGTPTERGKLRQTLQRAERRTRLWSMISTMTASLPFDGPSLTRTTRPTWTKRLKLEGASIGWGRDGRRAASSGR